MIDRQQAINILNQKIINKNLRKHCLAVAAIMKDLAEYFNEDKKEWEIVGLLHDIDYEETKNDSQKHSICGADYLKSLGFKDNFCEAIKTHNEAHGIKPNSLMAKALFVSDPISGIIVAATLVLPSKKIADLSLENILNRLKEKSFAKGVNRGIIKQCENLLGLSLEKFSEIALKAMKKIERDLEL